MGVQCTRLALITRSRYCPFSRRAFLAFFTSLTHTHTKKAWDLRKDTISHTMNGHTDSITGLTLSPDGTTLLSYAMDNTLRLWDTKPFATSGSRLLKTFEGAPHGFEKNLIKPCFSPDSDFIATGCGDRSVMIFNVSSGRTVYKLPGHKGCVNQVDWAGNVLASGSNDNTIFMGELNVNEVK